MAGTGLLVFTYAVLLLLAVGPFGWLFAAIVMLAASLHSWTMKSAADAPVTGVAVATGMGLAFAVAPRVSAFPLFALTLGMSIYLSLQIGTWSERAHAERMRTESYREALQASLAAEQAQRVGTLQQSVTELMALQHDQRNVSFALALNVSNLADEVQSPLGKSILTDIQRSLDQLTELLDHQQRAQPDPGAAELAELECVRLGDVAPTVARIIHVRYTTVAIDLDAAALDLRVLVRGGPPALQRILLNMMLNACEGDGGATRATCMALRPKMHPGGDVVVVELHDDGPGFPASVLERRVPFVTTKPGGSGLGLVTVQALVTASGGALSIRNGEPRGAVVALQLMVAPS